MPRASHTSTSENRTPMSGFRAPRPLSARGALDEMGRRLGDALSAEPVKTIGGRAGFSRQVAGSLRQGLVPGRTLNFVGALIQLAPERRLEVLEPVIGSTSSARLALEVLASSRRMEGTLADFAALLAASGFAGHSLGRGGAHQQLDVLGRATSERCDTSRCRAGAAASALGPVGAAGDPEIGGARVALESLRLPIAAAGSDLTLGVLTRLHRDLGGRIEPGEALALAASDPDGATGAAFARPAEDWRLGLVAQRNAFYEDPAAMAGRPLASIADRRHAEDCRSDWERMTPAEPVLIEAGAVVRRGGRLTLLRGRILRALFEARDGTRVLVSRFVLKPVPTDAQGIAAA